MLSFDCCSIQIPVARINCRLKLPSETASLCVFNLHHDKYAHTIVQFFCPFVSFHFEEFESY
jgi:hypothetical protein